MLAIWRNIDLAMRGLYCPPVIPAELVQALPELCQAWVVFRGRSWQVGLT